VVMEEGGGDLYSLFQINPGVPSEEVASQIPKINVQWVDVASGTRTLDDMEDRAAKYVQEDNLLLINADFRVFTDMISRWTKKYSHVAGCQGTVEAVVREWFAQQLLETIVGSLALKGSKEWSTPMVQNLWSEETLTAVVLPRYSIDFNIKRSLGSKLGSLKDAEA